LAVAKATAPPDPPSPVISEIIGIFAFKEVLMQLAIASACPLSSAPLPGYAPAVSIRVITGRENLSAKFISHDVTNEESWQNVIEETQMLFSQIDAVVNNAGSYNYQSILDCTHESFKSIIDTSLNGCFLGLKYGTEAIRKHNQGGSIVMMSSILSKIGAVNMSALSAAHGGVKLLAKAAACELGKEKIRINSIHPGLVDTFTDEEFEQNYPSAFDSLKFEKESIEMVPFQRKATPNEVAEAIRFLVSDESVFMTGAEIVIDGGFIAQ